jgi:hypothetical protein
MMDILYRLIPGLLIITGIILSGCAGLQRGLEQALTAHQASEIKFDMAGKKAMTISAHPDDELHVSPIIGKICNDLGRSS